MDNGKLNINSSSVLSFSISPGEEIKTQLATVTVNEADILIVRYGQDLDFSLKNARDLIKICEDVSKGNKVRVLVHTGKFGQMESATREYLSSEEVAKHRKAVALVIDNLPHRIIAHYIISMRKKYYPSKVFRSEFEAIKWLRTIP